MVLGCLRCRNFNWVCSGCAASSSILALSNHTNCSTIPGVHSWLVGCITSGHGILKFQRHRSLAARVMSFRSASRRSQAPICRSECTGLGILTSNSLDHFIEARRQWSHHGVTSGCRWNVAARKAIKAANGSIEISMNNAGSRTAAEATEDCAQALEHRSAPRDTQSTLAPAPRHPGT